MYLKASRGMIHCSKSRAKFATPRSRTFAEDFGIANRAASTRSRNVCLFRLLMGSYRNSVDSYKYAIPHIYDTIRAIITIIREANTWQMAITCNVVLDKYVKIHSL